MAFGADPIYAIGKWEGGMENQKEIVWGAAAIVAAGIVFAAYVAAPPRFSIARVNDGAAYRMDGHSGDMSLCFGFQCRPVSEEVPLAQESTPDINATLGENPAWRECIENAKDAVEAANCKALK